jgi:hypothetical protein
LQGRDVAVTIRAVTFEKVGMEQEQKAILYFVGKAKGVILNKTNCRSIVEITGSGVTEEWVGSVITLYPTRTEFQGETVDCIRVKASRGQAKLRMTPPPPVVRVDDDEIPF